MSVDVPPDVDLQRVRAWLIDSGLVWERADPSYKELLGEE